MIKVSITGMVVSLKTDLRFPIPGQQGHEGRIIHFGISNVSSRISNPLYGNGSVRIRSNPGNGTYVTIEFEQMEEDIDEKNNDRR